MENNKTKTFIDKAIKKHGDKYDYSNVNYINIETKIKIICSEHGEFEQTPHQHLKGRGCHYCGGTKKLTTDKFIELSEKIHGDKYDYLLVDYKTTHEKIKIVCPIHGEFEQTPAMHLFGQGCSECVGLKKLTTDKFIQKAKNIHGDKYDYSLVDYKNNKTKIKIICPEHGIFEQAPNSHYSNGCSKCSFKYKPSTEEIIKKLSHLHKNIYDYSLVEYKNAHTKIKIICKKHGVFEQATNHHLRGAGCPNCKISKGELKIKDWLDNDRIEYIQQQKFIDCKDKSPLPFDFYLPEYNICIEYDGRQHYEIIELWGGLEGFIDTKNKDNIKNIYCQNNKIKLIRIKYSENIGNKLKEIYL